MGPTCQPGMELEASTVRHILVLSHFTDEKSEAKEEQRLDRHAGTLAPRLVPLPFLGCC